ncbi:hypothetical protein Taro_002015 [Colocasia esculenta]|uniref:Uncharacterized protein n=1 Tax=Colocasia esculenta TaxID=4460 RepID=A0A843TG45_COLES|nr:hypothetical protein [Colocasia esculenta]
MTHKWDPSPKFSRGVPALKTAPGFPVKVKVQGEHVSVQSTKHGKIRQHKADASKVIQRKSNTEDASLQYARSEHPRGWKRKGIYRKPNYNPQGPENTRVVEEIPTQQSKARVSVFDRISWIPEFCKPRASPSTSARPSKRRRVTWAARGTPKLIIFSCYTTEREVGELAEHIAEATPSIPTEDAHTNIRQFVRRTHQPGGQIGPSNQASLPTDIQHEGTQIPSLEETNIQLEEGGPSTSGSHPVINLPTKENFHAMADDDKYEVMQQWRSEMTSLINEMRRLATSSHRPSQNRLLLNINNKANIRMDLSY